MLLEHVNILYPNICFIYLNIAIKSNHTFYREEATVKFLSVS